MVNCTNRDSFLKFPGFIENETIGGEHVPVCLSQESSEESSEDHTDFIRALGVAALGKKVESKSVGEKQS
jgi:hypothetical protein